MWFIIDYTGWGAISAAMGSYGAPQYVHQSIKLNALVMSDDPGLGFYDT